VQITIASPNDNQTSPFQKFVPKNNQTIPLQRFVPSSPVDKFDMMIHLTPHTQNQYMREGGWYEVAGWQIAISNPSSLCPSQNCTFQLEGGLMGQKYTPGERMVTGKLRINSDVTTMIREYGS
jgi:hypothetical protein